MRGSNHARPIRRKLLLPGRPVMCARPYMLGETEAIYIKFEVSLLLKLSVLILCLIFTQSGCKTYEQMMLESDYKECKRQLPDPGRVLAEERIAEQLDRSVPVDPTPVPGVFQTMDDCLEFLRKET